MTAYLDRSRLEAIDTADFRDAEPYPWLNPAGLLTEAGYARLRAELPDVGLFQKVFGHKRAHGQQPHDRYTLEYEPGLPVSPAWHDFIAELRGGDYRRFLNRLLGTRRYFLSFHWHYTPNGCSVSPHCDAPRKLGSHIFYLNTEADWRPEWGGETLILDDHGRFDRRSAPAFEDFDRAMASRALGNHSLLFSRRGNSWHGVREIRCPEGALRKVFIVVINAWTPMAVAHHLIGRRRRG